MEELLARIDWVGKEHCKGKRVRGSGLQTREKHMQREKQRRTESAALIDEMAHLVPQTEADAKKRTQVSTLRDTVDYLRRIHEVAAALIDENRRLSASLAQQSAVAHLASTSSSSLRTPTVSSKDMARIFVVAVFFFWITIGAPLPWANAPTPNVGSIYTSRHIFSTASLQSVCRSVST